jgi:hypothetical protein
MSIYAFKYSTQLHQTRCLLTDKKNSFLLNRGMKLTIKNIFFVCYNATEIHKA